MGRREIQSSGGKRKCLARKYGVYRDVAGENAWCILWNILTRTGRYVGKFESSHAAR